MWFGDESRFAMCVKEPPSDPPHLRTVDVYAAGRWLTCDDNSVYVPTFTGCLEREVARLLGIGRSVQQPRPFLDMSISDNFLRLRAAASAADGNESDCQIYSNAGFMHWGETADNVSALLFLEGDTAYIPFEFWRPDHHDASELGQVFVAELPARELAGILHEVAWKLVWEWAGYWASRS